MQTFEKEEPILMDTLYPKDWRYRWAPSLGRLESTAEDVWGIKKYEAEHDLYNPCVFFGVYGLPDFMALWKHKGRRCVLWAGTDITHFKNGYWLDDEGGIKLDPWALAEWINIYCESWTENEVEQAALEEMGIKSTVCPSFLGNIDDFPISYQHSEKPKVYASVSGDNFELYGWHKIPAIAKRHPEIEFHLYGSNGNPWPAETWPNYQPLPNIYLHGRVPKEQMNAEIMEMQGGLRLTDFDGFSEIIAKSILWGQYPIATITYPHVLKPDQLDMLKFNIEPNIEGRDYYRQKVNDYPWNMNKHANN